VKHAEISAQIEQAITSGALVPGDRLPPERTLAVAHRVSGLSEQLVRVGAPLMLVDRVAYDEEGLPVETARDVFRGDRTRIVAWTSELARA
jgi:DNA-binding GntR family transcriptional regulator